MDIHNQNEYIYILTWWSQGPQNIRYLPEKYFFNTTVFTCIFANKEIVSECQCSQTGVVMQFNTCIHVSNTHTAELVLGGWNILSNTKGYTKDEKIIPNTYRKRIIIIDLKKRKHAKFYNTFDLTIHYLCILSLNIDNQSPQLTSQPPKTELTGIMMLAAESTWTAEKHNFTTMQSKPEWHVNMKKQYQIHYVLYIYICWPDSTMNNQYICWPHSTMNNQSTWLFI